MRVAALPAGAPRPMITPRSFFSRHALRKAARSIVRRRVRMPTACKYVTSASAIEKNGGEGGGAPASKPPPTPALTRGFFASAGGDGGGPFAAGETSPPGGKPPRRAGGAHAPSRGDAP